VLLVVEFLKSKIAGFKKRPLAKIKGPGYTSLQWKKELP
jgi:hypothetical protein